ncbi:hypothetical protein MAR_025662 [Mya arenaria]|uniref:Uncharacterized protein n=1 Tax=Mya arenaria TaxID=6604 RepID=A0ABY7ENA8_MYAAR|nr:hypothetical protein MAR_025662 [Mya arenaria]
MIRWGAEDDICRTFARVNQHSDYCILNVKLSVEVNDERGRHWDTVILNMELNVEVNDERGRPWDTVILNMELDVEVNGERGRHWDTVILNMELDVEKLWFPIGTHPFLELQAEEMNL